MHGQTDDKSNEITAIPELLNLLVVEGCVVTIDVMGTQKEIVKKMRARKVDYTLAVKEKQGALYGDIKEYFEAEMTDKTGEFKCENFGKCEKGHGRIEKRQYYYSTDIGWLEQKKDWKDVTVIGIVIRTSTEKENTNTDTRYYISSIGNDVELFAKAVRKRCIGIWM